MPSVRGSGYAFFGGHGVAASNDKPWRREERRMSAIRLTVGHSFAASECHQPPAARTGSVAEPLRKTGGLP